MRALFVLFVFCAACASDDTAGDDGTGGGGGGGACSATNDTCAGETICVASSCVAAFPRVYRISNVQHTVGTKKSDGSDWDAGAGAPDLFVTFTLNGTVVVTTPVVDDSFSATWAGPFNVTLNAANSNLVAASYDEDLTVNDPGYGCDASPVTAADLRARTVTCSQATTSLSWRIDPQ